MFTFADYSCALQRDILVHGRLYISQNWLCFYANIFGWETFVSMQLPSLIIIVKLVNVLNLKIFLKANFKLMVKRSL